MFLTLFSALTVLSAVVSTSAQIPDDFAIVNLRIEGSTKTIFEGLVITRGQRVATPKAGSHYCDGTNNKQHQASGPTVTSALANAASGHFSFDGSVPFLR